MERLLDEDARATQLQYSENSPYLWRRMAQTSFLLSAVLENVNPDLSDSEFMDPEDRRGAESQLADTPTPAQGGDEESVMDEDDEGEIDEELAAELDMALGDEAEDGDDDGEDGDDEEDESEEEDEDEDEDDEAVQAKRLLNEEIRDLEAAVAKKKGEIASSANPIIKVRSHLDKYASGKLINRTSASVRGCLEKASGRSRLQGIAEGRTQRATANAQGRHRASAGRPGCQRRRRYGHGMKRIMEHTYLS